jgi:hypothetical protein
LRVVGGQGGSEDDEGESCEEEEAT